MLKYNKKRTSMIWNVSKEEFQKLMDISNSKAEVMKKLGCASGRMHYILNERIILENIDLTKFIENKRKSIKIPRPALTPLKEILIENCEYKSSTLKKRLIKEGLLTEKCYKCGLGSEWQSEPLVLQLDHINGIRTDNRIENLRILCPNCHTQTPTYGSKAMKILKPKIKIVCSCGQEKHKQSNLCKKCSYINRRKFEISKKELEKLILEKSMEEIGRAFNVSGASIKNRCKKLNIKTPERGHWGFKK